MFLGISRAAADRVLRCRLDEYDVGRVSARHAHDADVVRKTVRESLVWIPAAAIPRKELTTGERYTVDFYRVTVGLRPAADSDDHLTAEID
jgi:hypothetical protein